MHDAIVVGAGHNGLAAAVLLARAGWKVLVLEAQDRPGGAVRTEEVTLPGFLHDLYATNLNAFAGSEFYKTFRGELEARGLEFLRAAKPFCSPFLDGDLAGVTTAREETLADLRRLSPADADAWRALSEHFTRIGPSIFAVLRAPMPSLAALKGLPHLPLALQSTRRFVERHFRHPKIQALMAAWGMHLDFPPHVAGGALYPLLSCMGAQANGLAFAKGGARRMVEAMASLFRASGGELRCSAAVTRICVEAGTATGVYVESEHIAARRAVIANLAPKVLFNLLPDPPRKRFRHGPGTMMIHLALSDLPQWINPRACEFAYVHIAPSLHGMSKAYEEAMRGVPPEEPVLVVAQPTLVDPSRAPEGRAVLWIQVRAVPSGVNKAAYAERVLGLLERYAPSLRKRILGQCVLGPQDLEAANANLVGGDSIGGSHHLDQQFLLRPFLGWSHHRSHLRRLYMCGASTWPGAGTGAGSGWLLGRALAAELR